MSRVEFTNGIQCKKCGNIIVQPTIFTSELCQKCGTKLLDIDISDKSYTVDKGGKGVTVKVTHKFFRDIYEVVEAQQ